MTLTFPDAQAVESPCLSILVPLLVKGLRERAAVARKTGLIIHNMVKVLFSYAPEAAAPYRTPMFASSKVGFVPAAGVSISLSA